MAGGGDLYDGNTNIISPVDFPVDLFLVQMIIIVLSCRLMALLLRYIKQPAVIAEVITGIILGPSVLGNIPGYMTYIFPPSSIVTLNVVANWGLILFMFMVGLELDPGLLKSDWKRSITVSASGLITPFCLGLLSSLAIYRTIVDQSKVSYASFILFVGVAMSITAFPVLARILTETKLITTRLGSLAMSAAAVDDVTAWCLLALVVALARASNPLHFLYTVLALVAFIVFALFVLGPLLKRVARYGNSREGMDFNMVVFILILVLICSFYTDIIGVHSIFGSFVAGVVMPRENRFALRLTERLEDLVMALLLPLYFCYSGLRTNIAALDDGVAWGLTALIIFTACLGKIGAATISSRLLGLAWRESFVIGILMNTKGLVELIVLNLGLQVGVLTVKTFTMFVLMALFTTFMTTPLVHFLWIRHQNNAPSRGRRRGDHYSVLLCVPDLRAGVGMLNVAQTLQGLTKNAAAAAATNIGDIDHDESSPDGGEVRPFKVKAIYLNEITERPSSYFFDIAEKMRERPLLGSRTKNPLLEALKQHGTNLGMALKTKVMTSHEMTTDIVRFAQKQNFDFVILGWNDPFFVEQLDEPQSGLSSSQIVHKSAIGDMLDRGLSSVFGTAPSSQIVHNAVQRINSSVGVLIDKAGEHPVRIKRVLLLHSGRECDVASLDLVMRMQAPVHITILDDSEPGSLNIPEHLLENNSINNNASNEADASSLDGAFVVEGDSSSGGGGGGKEKEKEKEKEKGKAKLSTPRIKITRANAKNVFNMAHDEVRKFPYDLVLVGMADRSRPPTEEPGVMGLVRASHISILLVYPPTTTTSSSSSSSASSPRGDINNNLHHHRHDDSSVAAEAMSDTTLGEAPQV